MSNLAYEDSWEDEFTSKGHENWRNQDLLPETKAILEENERIKSEKKQWQERRNTLPFSEPLAIEICERVSSGELLINICADEHLPTVRRVTQWLRENQDFALLYKDSISDRLTIFEEEVIKIADDASRDFRDVVRNGRTVRVLDGDAIAGAKLRVEVRLKHLKAYKPSIWGETSILNVRSSDPNDIDNMTQEEMDKKIAELESKEAVVREPKAA
jgi:terminase small subunit-like protein